MKDENTNLKKQNCTRKRMSFWKLAVIDLTGLAVGMGLFMMFDYVLPQSSGTSGETIADLTDYESSNFDIPESAGESVKQDSKSQSEGSSKGKHGDGGKSENTGGHKKGGEDTGNTNTSSISSDVNSASDISSSNITSTFIDDYSDDNIKITINEKSIGNDSDKITYYTADIYVTNIKYLKSAFADNEYGKNIKDTINSTAEQNDAVIAVNGDFYGNGEDGVVIRNGVLYRSDTNDADICVLFTNGEMKTYSPEEFNCDDVILQGAWQAWTFGPALLDGNGSVLSSFNTTSYLNSENPRTAIGYAAPGHYILTVVDGRSEGHSRGATLSELAQIMADEGCISAYNLDGGKSSGMVFRGEYINEPVSGGREVSDIIYL